MSTENITYIKQAIKDGFYSVSGWIYCYECDCIEDENYHCTTCGNYSGYIEDTLKELVDHIEYLEKQLADKSKPSKKSVLGTEEEQLDMFGGKSD